MDVKPQSDLALPANVLTTYKAKMVMAADAVEYAAAFEPIEAVRNSYFPASCSSNAEYRKLITTLYKFVAPKGVYQIDSSWRKHCAQFALPFFPIASSFMPMFTVFVCAFQAVDPVSFCAICASSAHRAETCRFSRPAASAKGPDISGRDHRNAGHDKRRDNPSPHKRTGNGNNHSYDRNDRNSGNGRPNSQGSSRNGNTAPHDNFCGDYNSGACSRNNCRYRHACSKCSQTNHTSATCQQRGSN
jgi:hypothetical protein